MLDFLSSINNNMKKIAIIGSGSWGVALAIHLAKMNNEIKIWSYEEKEANLINNEKKCMFLPNVELPNNINCFTDIEEVVKDSDIVLHVTPSKFTRNVVKQYEGMSAAELKNEKEALQRMANTSSIDPDEAADRIAVIDAIAREKNGATSNTSSAWNDIPNVAKPTHSIAVNAHSAICRFPKAI